MQFNRNAIVPLDKSLDKEDSVNSDLGVTSFTVDQVELFVNCYEEVYDLFDVENHLRLELFHPEAPQCQLPPAASSSPSDFPPSIETNLSFFHTAYPCDDLQLITFPSLALMPVTLTNEPTPLFPLTTSQSNLRPTSPKSVSPNCNFNTFSSL